VPYLLGESGVTTPVTSRGWVHIFPEVLVFRSIWSYRPYRWAYPLVGAAVVILYAVLMPLLFANLFGSPALSDGIPSVPVSDTSQVAFAVGMGLLLPALIFGALRLQSSTSTCSRDEGSTPRVSGKVTWAILTSLIPGLAPALVGCCVALGVLFTAVGAATLAPTLGYFLGVYAWVFYTATFLILWYALRLLGRRWRDENRDLDDGLADRPPSAQNGRGP
jgi:hypothetical protein